MTFTTLRSDGEILHKFLNLVDSDSSASVAVGVMIGMLYFSATRYANRVSRDDFGPIKSVEKLIRMQKLNYEHYKLYLSH